MDTRGAIEAILDKAYAARQRQDVAAAAACFTEDGWLPPQWRSADHQPGRADDVAQGGIRGV
jgi:hypothetical protein